MTVASPLAGPTHSMTPVLVRELTPARRSEPRTDILGPLSVTIGLGGMLSGAMLQLVFAIAAMNGFVAFGNTAGVGSLILEIATAATAVVLGIVGVSGRRRSKGIAVIGLAIGAAMLFDFATNAVTAVMALSVL
ncbi:hypothetical protein ACFSBZ_00535 [Amnibacterium flavum]|uniref:Uncharacterized protein n=1 Tax=Amnibacterium flavum TaxID=2173173 RepID=A0A2V1HLR6_9MICO|nr:hypothetical protein [Amnibacterium flavum]PVZ93586.1 hypothetical protein DDQ50_14855 [Amnibacterium flavum]